MAELVYAFDLKSNGVIHMGSSPISGTKISLAHLCYRYKDFPFHINPSGSSISLYFVFSYFIISKKPYKEESRIMWLFLIENNLLNYTTYCLHIRTYASHI